MYLLPVDNIQYNTLLLEAIDREVRSIYRKVIFNKNIIDDDILNTFLTTYSGLTELVGIKNAQMEAQTEDELIEYINNNKNALAYIINEIDNDTNFEKQLQLFQLLKIISPDTFKSHPNKFRSTLVKVGEFYCAPPENIPFLVEQLFYNLSIIKHPVIRSIYLHHELIRIHPFLDGNGRVTRLAQNWILMFDIYPPVSIDDITEKKLYIDSLSKSFTHLDKLPFENNEFTNHFFNLELTRLQNTIIQLDRTISGKK